MFSYFKKLIHLPPLSQCSLLCPRLGGGSKGTSSMSVLYRKFSETIELGAAGDGEAHMAGSEARVSTSTTMFPGMMGTIWKPQVAESRQMHTLVPNILMDNQCKSNTYIKQVKRVHSYLREMPFINNNASDKQALGEVRQAPLSACQRLAAQNEENEPVHVRQLKLIKNKKFDMDPDDGENYNKRLRNEKARRAEKPIRPTVPDITAELGGSNINKENLDNSKEIPELKRYDALYYGKSGDADSAKLPERNECLNEEESIRAPPPSAAAMLCAQGNGVVKPKFNRPESKENARVKSAACVKSAPCIKSYVKDVASLKANKEIDKNDLAALKKKPRKIFKTTKNIINKIKAKHEIDDTPKMPYAKYKYTKKSAAVLLNEMQNDCKNNNVGLERTVVPPIPKMEYMPAKEFEYKPTPEWRTSMTQKSSDINTSLARSLAPSASIQVENRDILADAVQSNVEAPWKLAPAQGRNKVPDIAQKCEQLEWEMIPNDALNKPIERIEAPTDNCAAKLEKESAFCQENLIDDVKMQNLNKPSKIGNVAKDTNSPTNTLKTNENLFCAVKEDILDITDVYSLDMQITKTDELEDSLSTAETMKKTELNESLSTVDNIQNDKFEKLLTTIENMKNNELNESLNAIDSVQNDKFEEPPTTIENMKNNELNESHNTALVDNIQNDEEESLISWANCVANARPTNTMIDSETNVAQVEEAQAEEAHALNVSLERSNEITDASSIPESEEIVLQKVKARWCALENVLGNQELIEKITAAAPIDSAAKEKSRRRPNKFLNTRNFKGHTRHYSINHNGFNDNEYTLENKRTSENLTIEGEDHTSDKTDNVPSTETDAEIIGLEKLDLIRKQFERHVETNSDNIDDLKRMSEEVDKISEDYEKSLKFKEKDV